jgi:hypothetical protein
VEGRRKRSETPASVYLLDSGSINGETISPSPHHVILKEKNEINILQFKKKSNYIGGITFISHSLRSFGFFRLSLYLCDVLLLGTHTAS